MTLSLLKEGMTTPDSKMGIKRNFISISMVKQKVAIGVSRHAKSKWDLFWAISVPWPLVPQLIMLFYKN